MQVLLRARSSCHRRSREQSTTEDLQKPGAMKLQRLSSDIISKLPLNTIDKILTLMPIRDAVRTSILSRKWRYRWTKIPVLVFDDKLVNGSYRRRQLKRYKLINSIFLVLLLHKGPILDFSISIGDRETVNELDQIILHLSRSNNSKKFNFKLCLAERFEIYKIPSSFFSLQGLEHLDLTYCAFELPSIFHGFIFLKSLRFRNVEIAAKMLQKLLTRCPLLEKFILIENQEGFTTGGDTCTFIELFECLPSIQVLKISETYIKHFAAGGMPQTLPTPLIHLRILVFNVCFLEKDELSSVLCVISSSPNLEKIRMEMSSNDKLSAQETSNNFLDLQDYSGLKLNHLKELEITRFSILALEMEFLKLIMVISTVLEKARIELNPNVSVDQELNLLRDLVRMSFPRASPAADVIIERPNKSRSKCK
ncbi:unnamed protein product [Lactuca virosa]|uniref:F-box domain-containing protein n=1 Tax=Lactuca virosa TaxID=75947 RepID=A0AAU9M485_9ASTR|nr:unnamed protein product [Lactuca virosa]